MLEEPQEEENRPQLLSQEAEGEVDEELELDPTVARVEADVVDGEDIVAGVMLTRMKKKANKTRTVNTVRVSFVDLGLGLLLDIGLALHPRTLSMLIANPRYFSP